MAVPHSGSPATLPVTADAALDELTARSGRFKGEPSFDVMAYGAVGDGSTDDTAAIQLAIDAAAASGGVVNGSSRRYKVTSTLTLSSNVRLRDMVLDASSWTADDTVLEATGSAASAVLLASDAAERATTITLTDATGIATDDWLLLSSTSVFGSTSQPRGEIVRVASVAGPTVTLYDPLADDYATADSAQAQKLTFVEGVQLERVNITGPSDDTLSITGLALDIVRDAVVRDCTFTQTHYAGITLTDAIGARVIGCHFDREEKSGLAYGVAVLWASQDVTISGCTGNRMRHLVTIGGGTGRPGIARRVAVTGCTISQAIDAGFDCHPAGEDISFVGNHVYGSDSTGIAFQGASGVILGNTIRGAASHGIMVQALTVKPHDILIGNNRIIDVGGRGILVQRNASYSAWSSLVMADNTVDTCGSLGIDVDASANRITGLTFQGNVVRGSTSHPLQVRSVDYATIVGNIVEIPAASLTGIRVFDCTRATVTGNSIKSLSTTSTQCIRLVPGDDCTIIGNTGTGAAIGILFDSSSENNTVIGNNMRGNTTPLSLSTGTGNISTTASASGAYNAV